MVEIPKEELVLIEKLKFDNSNPNVMNKKQFEALKKSIEKYGFIIPVITNKDYIVADGEHRIKAAKELNMEKVRVIRLPIKDVDRKILRQVLNKLRGEHDKNLDLLEFKEIMNLDGGEEFKELLAMQEKEFQRILDDLRESKEEDYEVPVKEHVRNIKTNIKRGDVYILGEHLLICGDATNKADVSILMGEDKADMVFTDPPYGVDYSSKNVFLNSIAFGNRIEKDIFGDTKDFDIENLWRGVFTNIQETLRKGGSFYITFSGDKLLLLLQILQEVNLPEKQILVWVKNNHVLGRSTYNYKHEFILYGWKEGGKRDFNIDFDTTVWEFNKPLKNDLHPTMKPIELITKALKNSSQEKQIIQDLLGGSGSTLIACEQTNRKCRIMEIDPQYCQIIINRWENYTKQKAKKIT